MTLRLRVQLGGEVREFSFDRPRITVGRAPSSDVLLQRGPRHSGYFSWQGDTRWFTPDPHGEVWRCRGADRMLLSVAGGAVRAGDQLELGASQVVEVLDVGSRRALSWTSVTLPPPRPGTPSSPVGCALALGLHALLEASDPTSALGHVVVPLLEAGGLGTPRAAWLVIPTGPEEFLDDMFAFDGAGESVEDGGRVMARFAAEADVVLDALSRGDGVIVTERQGVMLLVGCGMDSEDIAFWAFSLNASPDLSTCWPETCGCALGAVRDATVLAVRLRRTHRQHTALREENDHFRERERRHHFFKELVNESASMKRVQRHVKHLARGEGAVAVIGEAGTGKELIARALHHLTERRAGLFILVLPDRFDEEGLEVELFGHAGGALAGEGGAPRQGVFELAQRGTVYIEEIDRVPLGVQSKLARLLREGEVRRIGGMIGRPVHARVVVSAHRPLRALAQEGTLRHDLFMLLKDRAIIVPPLRERGPDLLPLARIFMEKFARRYSRDVSQLSPEVTARMEAHDWPGNIRELQTLVESMVLKSRPGTTTLTLEEMGLA